MARVRKADLEQGVLVDGVGDDTAGLTRERELHRPVDGRDDGPAVGRVGEPGTRFGGELDRQHGQGPLEDGEGRLRAIDGTDRHLQAETARHSVEARGIVEDAERSRSSLPRATSCASLTTCCATAPRTTQRA